jgi:hypothetical protein
MFIWFSSNNGRPGFGCCSWMLFLLPLSLCLMSSGSDSGIFMMILLLAVLAAIFVLPQMRQMRRVAVPDMVIPEKRKRDDDLDNDYLDKPKRLGDGYVLTDDGEVIPSDEDINRHGNFSGGV